MRDKTLFSRLIEDAESKNIKISDTLDLGPDIMDIDFVFYDDDTFRVFYNIRSTKDPNRRLCADEINDYYVEKAINGEDGDFNSLAEQIAHSLIKFITFYNSRDKDEIYGGFIDLKDFNTIKDAVKYVQNVASYLSTLDKNVVKNFDKIIKNKIIDAYKKYVSIKDKD